MGGYTLGNYGIAAPAPQISIGNARFELLVKSELALTAWRHGKDYGSHVASVAIAQVIANRQRKGWGTWLDCIANIPKHSATLEQPTGWPTAWDRNFLRILTEMDGVVENTTKDSTNGGLFWADLTNITSEFFLEKIARSSEYVRCADMNTLVFWKPVQ
jgi:hypothetical protein